MVSADPQLDMSVEGLECTTTNSPSGPTRTGSTPSTRTARSGGGRPQRYRLPNGERVPSVTTITKRFSDSGGLIRWAHQRGLDGEDIDEIKDTAGAIGSAVHDAVEAFVCGSSEEEARAVVDRLELEADRGRAVDGFAAFLAWWEMLRPEIVATEQPLVHERWRFGGTLDAIGRVRGDLCVLDWKTSNGTIYSEYLSQLAAYSLLWREGVWNVDGTWVKPGEGQQIAGFHLLRFSKNTGGFSHFYLPAKRMEPALSHFLLLRRAYESDRAVKDLLK